VSRTTLVIGGGITGLTAARRIADLGQAAGASPDKIIVCEAAPRLGGKLHRIDLACPHPELVEGPELVERPASFTVDVGAESLLARRPEGLELINELGLDELRVHPTPARPQVFIAGRVKPLPPTNMGIPTDLDSLQDYLSPDGFRRSKQEVDLPAEPLAGDVAIGTYVAERFGDEVTDRLLEPMLGGVYAGQSRRLSFEAVHPALFAAARNGGSLLSAARQVSAAARRSNDSSAGGDAPPVFAGLVGGVSGLVSALADDLESHGVVIRTGTTVREITRIDDHYQVIIGPVPRPEMIIADRIVITTPAASTARLLTRLVPEASALLAEIPYASMAVVSFVLAEADLQGSGLLVPPGELPTIKAFTYSQNKWQWIAERAAESFGPGAAVARASVGRFGEEHLLQVDDRQLIDRTLAEARQVPGWESARLLSAHVQRWGGGLPQYLVGHRQRVAQIRAAVAGLPGIAVAGAYLDGLGLPACIASGRQAVETVLT
jgi:oxygen-dependent protoporphyrinogen oxidase